MHGSWNQIDYVDELELPADDRDIIVTIHDDSPHQFTHRGAPWITVHEQPFLTGPFSGCGPQR